MNNLSDRSVTKSALFRQATTQSPSPRSAIDISACVKKIEEDYSLTGLARLHSLVVEDMSAASSQLRMNDTLETNTDSWEELLNDWVNKPGCQDKKEKRTSAVKRIRDCVKENSEILDLSNLMLSSLPPVLHHCKALKELKCDNNRFTQLDLEDLKGLEKLSCSYNQLTRLNLKGCNALKDVHCIRNQLGSLDLEGCVSLQKLYCNNNQLTQLNLKGCQALNILHCHNNQLRRLNLKGCHNLMNLLCTENRLTQLNLKGCNRLQQLYCKNNHILRFEHLDFLLEMAELRHIAFSNTAIGWGQLPEAIRDNQNIFIDIRPQEEHHQALNYAQNTHTESIHRCASQNALTLKSKYSTHNLEEGYLEFCKWINQLPVDGAAILNGYANDSYKNLTAKEWIANPQYLEHKDQTSDLTVKGFLALAWQAAKDPAQRESDVLEIDAKKVFIDALYEIRRGYNLDAAHNPKDDDKDAENICAPGTFNKISEKLVSVIQGMSSFMVTAETFQFSLNSTLRKAVKALRKDNRSVDDALNENNNLLTADVWGKIKTDVIDSIKEEFKDNPTIAGKDLDQHISEQTDYEQVLQYFAVSKIQEHD